MIHSYIRIHFTSPTKETESGTGATAPLQDAMLRSGTVITKWVLIQIPHTASDTGGNCIQFQRLMAGMGREERIRHADNHGFEFPASSLHAPHCNGFSM